MVRLYNTLTKKGAFTPIDKDHVKMYVCGPTVYDTAHIGNARSVVVYDVLFQLLKFCYGKVTYVRNITDIDDKIINAASEKNSNIESISTYYTKAFHEDMRSINCAEPTHEPKATKNVDYIIKLIEHLLQSGHAYESDKHVYFNIESYHEYGALSGKKLMNWFQVAELKLMKIKSTREILCCGSLQMILTTNFQVIGIAHGERADLDGI